MTRLGDLRRVAYMVMATGAALILSTAVIIAFGRANDQRPVAADSSHVLTQTSPLRGRDGNPIRIGRLAGGYYLFAVEYGGRENRRTTALTLEEYSDAGDWRVLWRRDDMIRNPDGTLSVMVPASFLPNRGYRFRAADGPRAVYTYAFVISEEGGSDDE